jgi:hypothetical protein
VKKKYDAAKERLENDVKEITELIQVKGIIFPLISEAMRGVTSDTHGLQ